MHAKVSIIIPSYSEFSKPYLDLCIESIRNLDYDPKQIEVIISTPKGYKPIYDAKELFCCLTVHHPDPKREFAEAVNYGVECSDLQSKYLLILSDDTIMTRDSLKRLTELAADELIMLNATSNCDNGWKYALSFIIESDGQKLLIADRFFKKEDIAGHELAMMNAKSNYPVGMILTDLLCLYATLIPRKVWDTVGQLDEQFKTGYEDSDYSARAKAAGITMAIALNAIIWHFGGIATSTYLTDGQTAENKRKIEAKYGVKT